MKESPAYPLAQMVGSHRLNFYHYTGGIVCLPVRSAMFVDVLTVNRPETVAKRTVSVVRGAVDEREYSGLCLI